MMAGGMLQLWRRFLALERGDRWLLAEAVILLGIIHAGIRTLPFATLSRVLAGAKTRPVRSRHPRARIGWAITAASRLVPGRSCLSDALAADVMLCRRGCQSTLKLGVKKKDGAAVPLEAHAWVECDGVIVTGQIDGLDEYTLLANRGGAG